MQKSRPAIECRTALLFVQVVPVATVSAWLSGSACSEGYLLRLLLNWFSHALS
jgi:hypothetical protein